MDSQTRRKGFLFLTIVIAAFAAISMSVSRSGHRSAMPIPRSGKTIGVVEVYGVIEASEAYTEWIEELQADTSIDAILVRIDSPGGSVAPSQEVYDALMRARKDKPVYATMASIAASGGYYIASAASEIFANPGTLTGSIGVIFPLFNFSKLMSDYGVASNSIKSGEFKDIASPYRSMTTAETELLQTMVNQTYEQFITAIMAGRDGRIDEPSLRAIADGRIVTGQQAKDYHLVDSIGGYYEAVTAVATKLGVNSDQLDFRYPPRRYSDLLDWFVQNSGAKAPSFLHSAGIEHSLVMYMWQWPTGALGAVGQTFQEHSR